MDRELLLKRLCELLVECDEWMLLETGAELKYYLEITANRITAQFDQKETTEAHSGFPHKVTMISTERINLPLTNKTGLKVLLAGLLKEFIHPTQIEVELEKRFNNGGIQVWFADRQGIDVQITFGSTIDRLKGLEVKSKGNRFISSSIQQ